MISKLSEKLIKIIDERINKKLKESGFVSKYVGVVTKVSADNKTLFVKLVGDETEFSFLNKTGELVSVGDGVKIEIDSSGLSGGYVSERFGGAKKDNIFPEGLISYGSIFSTIDNSVSTAAFTGASNATFVESFSNNNFSSRRQLVLGNNNVSLVDALRLTQTTNGSNWSSYKIFGEHFKPFVTGSYTGNYNTTPTQTIYLGFTPSAVIIAKNGTALMYMSGNAGISIVENGFAISDTNTNTQNNGYTYIAFR